MKVQNYLYIDIDFYIYIIKISYINMIINDNNDIEDNFINPVEINFETIIMVVEVVS